MRDAGSSYPVGPLCLDGCLRSFRQRGLSHIRRHGMPDVFLTFLTIALGVLNVFQFIQYFVDRKVRDANKKHMLAMKYNLQSLREACVETVASQEVFKNEA